MSNRDWLGDASSDGWEEFARELIARFDGDVGKASRIFGRALELFLKSGDYLPDVVPEARTREAFGAAFAALGIVPDNGAT